MSATGLGPHTKHNRKENPCPICGKVGGCLTFADGVTLCLRVPGDGETKSRWHVHRPTGTDWRDALARPTPAPAPTPVPPREPDPDLCDRVYRHILDACPLSDEDLEHLQRDRDLTPEQIQRHGPFGAMTEERRRVIAAETVAAFGPEIVGQVPGLYWRSPGEPGFSCELGLVIPIRDLAGRVIRLRIRTGLKGRKYVWCSSGERSGGIGSGTPVHVVMPRQRPREIKFVAIVEGEFKAIAIADRLGIPAISVAGVNAVAGVIPALAEIGTPAAVIFYDTDAATNLHVAAAEKRLTGDITDAGYVAYRATWSEHHKGIDDALSAGEFPILMPVVDTDPKAIADRDREIAELRRSIGARDETIATLRIRIEIADEQLGTYRNPKLGASKAVGAALIEIFRSDRPRDPGRISRETGGFVPYRVPLGRLADMTGLSQSACSRQIKGHKHGVGLASYSLHDGTPLLHWDVVEVSGGLDPTTGEITNPHMELWLGPGVAPQEFGKMLASFDPGQPKAWGGKRPDGVCANHPQAGVLERTRYQRIRTYECADCNQILEERITPIAPRSKVEHLQHIPTKQVAGLQPTDDGADDPTQQLARTLSPDDVLGTPGNVVHLPSKLRDRKRYTPEEQAQFDDALAAWSRPPSPAPDPLTDVAIGGKR